MEKQRFEIKDGGCTSEKMITPSAHSPVLHGGRLSNYQTNETSYMLAFLLEQTND